ncbi:MAG: lactonase family protein [Acidobacteriaceae bacterium]|nr:lactonase family protein [Acidobacteriaceae bacterium]
MSAQPSSSGSPPAHQAKFFLYIGTYEKGVYAYRYSTNGGSLDAIGLTGDVKNPSFLATDRDFRSLYAVSELEGKVNGVVAAFAIDRASGALKLLNTESSAGEAPCHLSVDHSTKWLFVANYTSGNVSVFPIETGGRLGKMSDLFAAHGSGVNPKRQEGPHAHQAVVSPDNRFLYVPDLGLDQIHIFRIDAAHGKLTPNDPPAAKVSAGYGPRHIAFTPDARFAYVINELEPFVTILAHDAASGQLREIRSMSILPAGATGENGPAEIAVDRAGNFLYVSNRGPGTIAVFGINKEDGMLSPVQVAATGGSWPRGFELDPSGRFLFAGDQKADQFVIFDVDPASGKLSLTGRVYHVPSPVAFLFVPSK